MFGRLLCWVSKKRYLFNFPYGNNLRLNSAFMKKCIIVQEDKVLKKVAGTAKTERKIAMFKD